MKKLAKRKCDGAQPPKKPKPSKPKPSKQCQNISKKFKFGTMVCGSGNEKSVNTTCTVNCIEGYEVFNSTNTITCLENGKWSGKIPKVSHKKY